MALILDKSITGITSVDESGNTLTTGFTNLSYTDEFGNIHENPYLVIDSTIINKLNKYNEIRVFIFKDKTSRDNKIKPILDAYYTASNNLYDQYFLISNMLTINIFQRSYEFINENIYSNWKSDE
jgi:hypothetical protein